MKIRFLAVLLFVAALCMAQTASQSAPAPPDTKAACPMMAGKDAKSCCQHKSAAKDGKAMSCCEGKDGISCMKDGGKTSASGCCQGKDHKDCCDKCEKASGETAMACCGNGGHCGMNHERADLGE